GREIIFSVFTPPGALHDGGMVIQGDRVVASGVLFPLSNRSDLPTELGTRHRAALGLSEATDALAIIISEETGKISLADNGSLLYDVKTERLAEMLEKALKNRLVKTTKKAKQTIRSERREKSLV
ncbi:MAG: DNA integrity scanning protein DisA nucleotide-binding domain protein, partial [Candidatus Omnitrophica bacterium]|nr:DNA integrity scanning protein DisA nucleotide-binding domain protein [Candidatus Omnitrophota bacterium]